MGGQQAESAYARVDYVDGKFREHEKKHSADMNGIKVSFEQAAEKYNELKEQVIGLKAVVESLQKMFAMCKNNELSNDTKNMAANNDCWVDIKELVRLLKSNDLEQISYYNINLMLVWAGHITRTPVSGGAYYNYKVTDLGEQIDIVRVSQDRAHQNRKLKYNSSKIFEINNLIKEYKAWLSSSRRGEE